MGAGLTTGHIAPERRHFILTLETISARGQVAAVTAMLETHGAYIEEFAVFDDTLTSRFYVRAQFHIDAIQPDLLSALQADYARFLAHYPHSLGDIFDATLPVPAIVMVSKTDHCLNEILAQIRNGALRMKIVAIVSNHTDAKNIALAEGIPFHHLPVTPQTKPQQESALLDLVNSLGAEFVVLARYMQVLSDDVCRKMSGRIINIHHSFLPGFKGARPYEQAYTRGVKLVGATAHFVTSDLDEGPIIEQALERVDHTFLPERILNMGRHIESMVLERALRLVFERRVFVNGLRCIVLR
ncbi:MAG: formyltetrahydrofolate deformylase [Burkholderiaceae bacterium]|nr:formyltetrahydrofolate deformylase [Burkholderiaceae bacterium]